MEAISGADSTFEKFLCDKSSLTNTPIGATFELIPTCNMNCKMCYVRMEPSELREKGGVLPASFWIDLGQQVRDAGTLFVLLTGGEPLLYPYFEEVYVALHEMGFILTINTNGTLVNERIVDIFKEYPPRRLNITLYGKDDETYGRLCRNPKGFTQLCHGIELLKAANIQVRFSSSLTPDNHDQLADFWRIADNMGIPIVTATYMMPPNRKSSRVETFDQLRLPPEQAAELGFLVDTHRMDEAQKQEYIHRNLFNIHNYVRPEKRRGGFTCRGANAAYWVNWDGTMVGCGMLTNPIYDLKEKPFLELWQQMVRENLEIFLCDACRDCNLSVICQHCASAEMTENQEFGSKPMYLCRYTEQYYHILKREAKEIIDESVL